MSELKDFTRREMTHSPPSSETQGKVHKKVSDIFLAFGDDLADVVPDCDDARKMVNFLTLARALAQKAVAQNFNLAEYLDKGGEL